MRAVIYARQSLDKSGDGLAVERQLAECRALVERHGWEVAKVYTDNDVSATSGKPRPEWSALLADLRAGLYDVLVTWHTDRLYRRLRDLVELVELAEDRPLRVATVTASDIDLSSPAGRMLAGMLGSAGRYEMEQKSARQRTANRQRAERGLVQWTRRPYGFTREGGRAVIVPEEAEVIREVARRVLEHETTASICADLEARGVRTTADRARWHVSTLRRVMLNPRLAGRLVYRGEDMGKVGPAILDDDTHERVRAVLSDPRRRTAPQSLAAKWLLSGLAECGRCGHVMYAIPTPRGTMSYTCRGCGLGRDLVNVDAVAVGAICERLSRPDASRLLSVDVDVDALRAEVVEVRGRRDGLAALLADGLLSPAAVKAQAEKLTARLADLERDIDAATGASPLAAVIGADDVRATFDALPIRNRRQIITTLATVRILPVGRGVRFRPEHVEIAWRGGE